MSTQAAATEVEGGQSFARRDLLLSFEREAQKRWYSEKIFEEDAPATDDGSTKYFVTFPYPYMNGYLHLGHGFSMSKTEFAVGYERMKGKRCLWPFAFHCTGMPIKACADKLKREIEHYGCPPKFPDPAEEVEVEAPEAEAPTTMSDTKDPTKFSSSKSKSVAKTGTQVYQWQILKSSGIPEEEISKFVDPHYWLSYFPPLAKEDLQSMGCKVDWRRSFITTDVNPYYDSFIRWQFNTLKKLDKIKFGKRMTVYSPLDGQPCADHDRASGEGVGPQEYTLIKMEVPLAELAEPFATRFKPVRDAGYRMFLGAATLRPETMYGQTNCWVLPEGDYGVYEVQPGQAIVMTERAALNLSYQGYSPEFGKTKCLLAVKGEDLIGLPLDAPNATRRIYALPMFTISTAKATGVVTSVPSDAPDDYAALVDLKKKDKLRQKYNVKDEWVDIEPIPIIDIPGFGTLSAPKVCTELKIQSQNDRKLLDAAKDQVYLKGFYDGVMIVGEHKGKKVQVAKPLIRQQLLDAGQAILYAEPEKTVMSRSGDECVVSLSDQWYITYGEDEWREKTRLCLKHLETYSEDTRHQFEMTLGWLREWACSRSFGLGTRLPWDPQFLIESLSDSTVYMAFYAFAHLLQGGNLEGSKVGPSGIRPEQLTDAVWDFILLNKDYPEGCGIPKATLAKLQREFQYWYPVDLRVSGKDLIQNHLTMFMYNHTAIFDEPHWPKAIRVNGHLMMNGEKMSKSKGNFLTLRQAMAKYSTDGMRFAMADAGDSADDANFVEATANAAILRLTTFLSFAEEMLNTKDQLRDGPMDSFADRAFLNDLNFAIRETDKNYSHMLYKSALRTGFYDLQSARDNYRLLCGVKAMHRELVLRFIEAQALLLAPICPHFCEKIYSMINPDATVMRAKFPTAGEVDPKMLRASQYLHDTVHEIRIKIQSASKPKKKKRADEPDPAKPTAASIVVADEYPEWQRIALLKLQDYYDEKTGMFPDNLMNVFKDLPDLKPHMKKAMPFVSYVKEEVKKRGVEAMELTVPFDEREVLQQNVDYITSAVGLLNLTIMPKSESQTQTQVEATPGKPQVVVGEN